MKTQPNDNGRLESFSDAVFAFAATLLVVSLAVPDSFELLKMQLRGFVSFGVSFGALVLIWRAHYSFFRRTVCRDNFIVFFNMLLLFVVLYFVYPLKFMATMMFSSNNVSGKNNFGVSTIGDLSQLFILYGIGFALIFFCYTIMYWRAAKKDIENEKELSNYKRHFFIFVIVAIISMIMAATNIGVRYGVPGFVYALLGPLCHFQAKWSEKKYAT